MLTKIIDTLWVDLEKITVIAFVEDDGEGYFHLVDNDRHYKISRAGYDALTAAYNKYIRPAPLPIEEFIGRINDKYEAVKKSTSY